MSSRNEPIVHSEEESALIDAFIRGGEREALAGFKFVYSRYRQRVMSYCVYYMHSQTLAEDAFQEVFSRVYSRRAQLREAKALKSWLLLITRSVCLNSLRQSKFTPEFVSTSTFADGENAPMTLDSPGDPAETLQADDMLKTMLARIAPIYREAFLMREFEGYDYDQIAELTGTTEMNVKVRITRAKKQLRQLLAPYYGSQASRGSVRRRSPRRSDAEPANDELVSEAQDEQVSEVQDYDLPNLGLSN
ncbi:MAG: RNA polymerase sigma factor [Bacteroidota bacterium]|nr:RNA polymerase sigma factor [Bacteroidota bacterium]MDP4234384.1 RNA polymerase sigma factor [Bacteroidota bacterium]MDP4243317.1 RNA polymerase sigma factor [Bacteroidota bacterium]MDP4288002.1 RNA polymerase sigma factor [Bacteroidota bacterium]